MVPFFYNEVAQPGVNSLILNEETSKHIVQVLRMKEGEQIQITNGKGYLLLADISDAHKKKTSVIIKDTSFLEPSAKQVTIAVSPLKNMSRYEWFVEKATELGVSRIIPLICTRTEKTHLKHERIKNILISAMLQSQQVWLPVLEEPQTLPILLSRLQADHKLIAHCGEAEKKDIKSFAPFTNVAMLIGPEGDFTSEEIHKAEEHGFHAITLGNTRLRTETAALTAAVILTR